MTQAADFTSTAAELSHWDSPRWATSRTVEENSIQHRGQVGEVGPIEYEAPIVVDVVQHDEFDVTAQPISVTRAPAKISLNGILIDGTQALQLAALLTTGAELIDG